MIASLTRAAAAEIAGRKLPIPRQQVGTLHAHCYRALNNPTIAETKIDEWNAQTIENYKMSHESSSLDDVVTEQVAGKMNGDILMQKYQVHRARMDARHEWAPHVKLFADAWEKWKYENGYFDFQDLISVCYQDIDVPPGDPRFIIIDECQDMDRQSIALVKKWGKRVDALIFAGDFWQNLYAWRGSDASDYLLHDIPDTHKRVLKQSYRIPASVHRYAISWMQRYLSTYTALDFRPRSVDGEVLLLRNGEHGESQYSYGNPVGIFDRITRYLEDGKRVMILTTCSYQLDYLLNFMRKHSIPFHNPYRRKRGDWNPLHPGNGQSSAERILAFLKGDTELYGPEDGYEHRRGFLPWTVEDLQSFVPILDAKVMKYGAKKRIGSLKYDRNDDRPPYTLNDFEDWFTDEAFRAILNVDLDWFISHVMDSKKKSLQYPIGIVKKYGRKILKEVVKKGKDEGPQIIIGTIHSVKGGEADVVVIFPDLSPSGMREWLGTPAQRDVIARLFYVGMTRAKETLVLCEPGSSNAIPWPIIQ